MHTKVLLLTIKLNLKQFSRILSEIGIARIIILSIIGITTLIRIIPLIDFSNAWIGVGVGVTMIPFLFIQNENEFFKSLDINSFEIIFLRNLIVSGPILFILLFFKNFEGLLIALLSVLSFSIVMRFKKRIAFEINIPQFLTFSLLPWTVGIRNSLPIIMLSFLTTVAGYYHIGFLFTGLILFHFIVTGFLNHNESQLSLQSFGISSESLLKYYSLWHIIFYLGGLLYFAIFLMIFSPDLLWVFMIISLLLVLHQYLSVFLKFTFYEPGKSNEAMQSIQTLMLFFLFIPFTLPIPIIYVFRYRKRALQNLNIYI